MKPYLLIAGEWYYPESGTNNWIGTFETEELAKEVVLKTKKGCYEDSVEIYGQVYDWHRIVDLMEWMNK